MLDKQLQGQNPLLGLLTGTGSTAHPVAKSKDTEDSPLDFKQVLDDENQLDRVDRAGELDPLEDVSPDSRSVATQQADKNQTHSEASVSLFSEIEIGAASTIVGAQESLLAEALPATVVNLTATPHELATTTESTSEFISSSEQAAGVLDPTSAGTTVLNSESVQRLNLLRAQNGAPQPSVGTQSNAVPASEPTIPVLFPAQDISAENLGVLSTGETPTANSVLGAQTNVAVEQALDSQLLANADIGIEQIAASSSEELPEQVLQQAGTASDRLGSQAAAEELLPASQNAAGLASVSLKPSREVQGQEVVSPNTLPTTDSSGQTHSDELSAAEQQVSDFPEESLESDAESEGNQLDGEANPQGITELETRESVDTHSSLEPFEQRFQAQTESAADSLRGSAEARSVAPLPNPVTTSFAQTQNNSTAEKLASPQATQFQASVAEAQGHGVVDQISQPLREHVSLQRDGTLQVNLEPAELGRVSITVQRTADGLAAQLVAAESLTTELLITQQQDLKDTLVNFGFDEVHVDVSQRDDNDRTGERTDSRRQRSDNNQLDEQQDVVENVNTSSGTINVVA